MSQLAFAMSLDPERSRRVWERVRRVVRVCAEARGIKAIAADWDVGHSQVSNKLDERDRHKLSVLELIDLMAGDVTGEALSALCDALGYERPARKRELDAQEKLDKLNAVLDANPELAMVVRRKAGLT